MRLAVSRESALRILRAIRSTGGRVPAACASVPKPDPAPRCRWSAAALPLDRLCLSEPPSKRHPTFAAVPTKADRLQASFFHNTIYASGLPDEAFASVGDGLFIPCPELLFLELAPIMSTAVHVLLGYELCGSFSRDPHDPRIGPVTFNVPPATTAEKIGRFLDSCHNVKGLSQARRNLAYIVDNAWSPLEALVASMATLPVVELGYQLGSVRLNERYENPAELVALGCRTSRVPDIEIVGASVGFNYDGREHFDPSALMNATSEQEKLDAARALREKYVDDLRRNRELAAQGRIILPVTTEDLFAEHGLDAVMLEATGALETIDHADMAHVRGAVASRPLRRARQRLIWSLLPWSSAEGWARDIIERERPKAMEIIETDLMF